MYFKFAYVKSHVQCRFQNSIFLLRWAIRRIVDFDDANIQWHYIKICIDMCFGHLVTNMLRHDVCPKVFFEHVIWLFMLQVQAYFRPSHRGNYIGPAPLQTLPKIVEKIVILTPPPHVSVFWRRCCQRKGTNKRSTSAPSQSTLTLELGAPTLSTAWSSMTSSESPSPEPLLKKRRPQPYWEGDDSGNALKASNAWNYRAWGVPAVLSRGNAGKALRAFPGLSRFFSGISSGKSQPYWGYGLPKKLQVHTKGVFSSENSTVSTGKKEVWCLLKSLFSREKKEKTHTPKSLPGVCGGPLRTGLVYKFWPSTGQ